MPETGWEMRENPTGVKMAGSCQSVEEAVGTGRNGWNKVFVYWSVASRVASLSLSLKVFCHAGSPYQRNVVVSFCERLLVNRGRGRYCVFCVVLVFWCGFT